MYDWLMTYFLSPIVALDHYSGTWYLLPAERFERSSSLFRQVGSCRPSPNAHPKLAQKRPTLQ